MTVFHFSGATFLASDKYISWCSLWLFISFAYPFCFKYSSISATVADSSSKDPKCMIWTQKPTVSGWCPKGRVNRSGSPRRLKAKYTPRTNLKICTPDISLLQRILYQYRALQPSIDTEKITPQFSVAVPLSNTIGTAATDKSVTKWEHPNTAERRLWQDTASFRCRSCPMSREEYRILQATQDRRTSMPPTEPQTIPFGVISQKKVSRNLTEAAHWEGVLKQGSLSSPCPKFRPPMSRSRCLKISQRNFTDGTMWNVYRLSTITRERRIATSTLSSVKGSYSRSLM